MRLRRHLARRLRRHGNRPRARIERILRRDRIDDIAIARAALEVRYNRDPVRIARDRPRQVRRCRHRSKPVRTTHVGGRRCRGDAERERRASRLRDGKRLRADRHRSRTRLIARILADRNRNEIAALAVSAIHNRDPTRIRLHRPRSDRKRIDRNRNDMRIVVARRRIRIELHPTAVLENRNRLSTDRNRPRPRRDLIPRRNLIRHRSRPRPARRRNGNPIAIRTRLPPRTRIRRRNRHRTLAAVTLHLDIRLVDRAVEALLRNRVRVSGHIHIPDAILHIRIRAHRIRHRIPRRATCRIERNPRIRNRRRPITASRSHNRRASPRLCNFTRCRSNRYSRNFFHRRIRCWCNCKRKRHNIHRGRHRHISQ